MWAAHLCPPRPELRQEREHAGLVEQLLSPALPEAVGVHGAPVWELLLGSGGQPKREQAPATPPPPGEPAPQPWAPGEARWLWPPPPLPSRVLCTGERPQHARGKHRRQRRGAAGIQGRSEQGPLKDGCLGEAETVPRPSRGVPRNPLPWVLGGRGAPGEPAWRQAGTWLFCPLFTPTLEEASTSGEAAVHLHVRRQHSPHTHRPQQHPYPCSPRPWASGAHSGWALRGRLPKPGQRSLR